MLKGPFIGMPRSLCKASGCCSYAFVLEHGLDAVNADMQSFAHLEQNVVAAATAPRYFA